jgi:hypothetical protein
MYHRLTQLTSQRTQVLVTACFTAVTFVSGMHVYESKPTNKCQFTIELLFFAGWCRPFWDYFALRPANSEFARLDACATTTYRDHSGMSALQKALHNESHPQCFDRCLDPFDSFTAAIWPVRRLRDETYLAD